MLGSIALDLIQELKRSDGNIKSFNEEKFRLVIEEMKFLFEQNQKDVNATVAGETKFFSGVLLRHSALERNKRCLLAYLYNRLKLLRNLRWELGSVIPPDIRSNLCEPEIQWFNSYNKHLASYMRSLGEGLGVDLTQHMTPPKSLFIQVRCLSDYGELETETGEVVVLKKHNQYHLPRAVCENLIRQGVLEHVLH